VTTFEDSPGRDRRRRRRLSSASRSISSSTDDGSQEDVVEGEVLESQVRARVAARPQEVVHDVAKPRLDDLTADLVVLHPDGEQLLVVASGPTDEVGDPHPFPVSSRTRPAQWPKHRWVCDEKLSEPVTDRLRSNGVKVRSTDAPHSRHGANHASVS
jgi:hypothetical protein